MHGSMAARLKDGTRTGLNGGVQHQAESTSLLVVEYVLPNVPSSTTINKIIGPPKEKSPFALPSHKLVAL